MEEIAIVQRIRNDEIIQRLKDETDRNDQKTREFKKALGIALQAIQRSEKEEERRKLVLNEEKKIDSFPQWKPQQGVIKKIEEVEVPILDDRD